MKKIVLVLVLALATPAAAQRLGEVGGLGDSVAKREARAQSSQERVAGIVAVGVLGAAFLLAAGLVLAQKQKAPAPR